MLFSYDVNKEIKPGGLSPLFKLRAWRAVLSLLIAFIAAIGTHLIVRAAPTILATMTAAFVGVHDGDGKADPGETIEYTAVIQNNGADPATGVTFSDVIDLNTTLVNGSLNVSPLAADDTYATIGNTLLDGGASAPDPAVHVLGLLANDAEFLGVTFGGGGGQTKITSYTNPTHGTLVSFDNNTGAFTYLPDAGYTGPDTFQYTLTDAGGLTDTGTVTINVNVQRVWYVKNDAAAGDGRSSSPFNTLAAAQSASAANDTIYVFRGDGLTTGQNAGISLKNGQRLIGEGVALTVPVSINGGADPTTLRAAGSQPQIDNTSGNGVSVTNISNVEIRGLNIAGSDSAVDVTTSGANSGSFELGNNTIRSSGTEGVDVNGGGSGTLTVNIHDNTVTATGNGIDILRTAGNVNMTTFDDNVVHGNTGGAGIVIVGPNVTFDATPGGTFQTILGGTTTIGQSGNAVGTSGMVLTNVSGDLSFTDLDIFANTGNGLSASGTTAFTGSAGFQIVVTPASPDNIGTSTINVTSGPALTISQATVDLRLSNLTSTTTTSGFSLTTVAGQVRAPSGSSITKSSGAGTAFNIASSSATVNYAGTLNVTSGGGVSLTGNTGSTITFSGGMTLSTGSNAAFTATGGGTVNICDEHPCNPGATGLTVNTLTTTTGTALNIANTTIGSNDLEFRSISSNGATNGIVLNSTGSSGNLALKGNSGSCTSAATCTGGAIQNAAIGVSLTSTTSPSFDRMFIQNTSDSGIKGTTVTNFSFTNGMIDNSGTGLGGETSNIAFNTTAAGTENNLSGIVTITGNMLTNAYYHGIDIFNFSGTISDANISNNTITSTNSTTTSKGTGIRFIAFGSASTIANVSKATIANNIVSNFPSAAGIMVQGGNGNTAGPAGVFGTVGSGTNIIAITGNRVAGFNTLNRMGTQAIIAVVNGKGQGNFNISNNGTVANPITNVFGTALAVSSFGSANVTATIDNNVIVANNAVGAQGIGAGTSSTWGTSDTPTLTVTITDNNISQTDGNGILATARDATGDLNVTIKNNNVASPLSGNRNGIRVDAGNGVSLDDDVCLDISGNTTAGVGLSPEGIGLRKQGTSSTTNTFGVVGMAATSSPGVETYVNGQNPGSSNGTLLISATSAFTNCSSAPVGMLPNRDSVLAQTQPENTSMGFAQAANTNLNTANTYTAAFASWKLAEQATESNLPKTVVNASTGSGGKPLFTAQRVPARSGETVSVPAFTLPAGKSVTIKFQVTVNGPSLPLGTTQISNQGTLSGSNFSNVLTDDPSVVGASDPTVTPVDRPDTTVTSINRAASTPTNAASVSWTVTVADAVSGLTSSNFTLATSGLGGSPAITAVTPVGAAPATQWTVTASTGTGEGTLGLNLVNDTGLSHDVTNLSVTGEVYTIDKIVPTTASFTRQTPSTTLTNADVLVFRVTFSEAIGGAGGHIGADDFVVTGTTATVTSIAFVSTGVYDVQVSGGDLASFNGVVGLNFSAGMAIGDLAGNNIANSEPSTDETYTEDNAAPNVTLSSGTSNPTNVNLIPVTVQFSEDVSGFFAADIVAGNATVGNFIAVDGDTYTFDLTPGGQGSVTADLAAGVATDAIGNGNKAAAQFSRTFDSDAPSVTIASTTSDPTNTSPMPVSVQFNENVTGFTASDLTLGNATASNLVAVDGDTYTFDLTVSGQGSVTVDIAAGVAQDSSGNGNSAATPFSRTFDSNPPTVTMTSAATDPTNTSPILVTAQFSENVTGFTASDITAGNASVGNFTAVDGDTYTFELAPLSDGLVTADIAAGVATDGANLNSAASQFSRAFDISAPTLTITSAAPDPTNTSPIAVTVQFDENVTAFTAADITAGNATVSNFVAVDGDTYTFDLTPSSEGLVTADISAGVAQDSGGNNNVAASQFNRTFDTLAPSVTVDQASGQADPTSASAINFTVVFSEPVTGFATGDVDLSAGTATGTLIGTVTGGPTTYNVAVSGMTGDGTVIASIAADVATDGANLNAASTSGDNNILYVANMTEHLISGNVGVGGVVLSYVDGTPKTVTSQANGNYSFPVSFNWTGLVTPAHTCYAFSPIDQNYSQVRTDQTAQNYTPTFDSAAGCAEIDVSIRGAHQGQFAMSPQGSTQASFAGMNKGPVKIESTNGLPFLSEQQVIYQVNGIDASFSEMMALPNNQLDTTYWLPWYNNKTLNTQLRIANVSPSQASVHVTIGGMKMAGSPFTLAPGQSIRKSFAGIDKGPVKIESNVDIVASERVVYNVNGVDTSYSEMMALPNSQLDKVYWLPWYNSRYLDTQLRIANVSPSQASVHVTIGELEVAGSPFALAPGQSIRKSFAGIDKGPVKIESNVDIVASERVVYNVNGVDTSYSEMMALPNDQLDTTYWLPWYNKVNMDMQLRFANVSNTTATVRVFMAGVEVAGSPFTLAPGQSIRKNFAGINTGPVKIVSTQKIVAAERVYYMANGTLTSFSEKMGLPDSQLDIIYWLPWYDKVNMDTQLRFVMP